jgi:crotonobetainyl-CoA:carnitine CoA-transferase CaiB-like acyl-CoA transferase
MQPLSGVRVLDLSRLLPGPYCTQLLVDLGAEVIKIEDPAGGDYVRYTPPLLEDGQSALFWLLNRGKKSVTLDLKSHADQGKFLGLCETADVVLESFRPGVMEKLGLSPRALLDRFPRLVIASISGYGQSGADRLRAGHDNNYLAKAGVLSLVKEPALLPVQIADIAGGALPAALHICAALVGRATTGHGAIIDVSMTHQSYGLATPALSNAAAPEHATKLGKAAHLLLGAVPCYSVYETADGHITVGSLEPKFWQGLCDALALPDLRARGLDHGDAGDEVRRILTTAFRAKTNSEWTRFFADKDVCVEVVRAAEDVVNDDQFSHVTVDVAGKPVRLAVPAPAIVGASPSTGKAPTLGEHNALFLSSAD